MSDFIEIPVTSIAIKRRSKIQGVGINDADYMVHGPRGSGATCPYYAVWKAMIQRCYNPLKLNQRQTYIDCTISNEWFLFSNFKKWMKTQDWSGKQLDKDIKFAGNRVYSQRTCLFVSQKINGLLNNNLSIRGSLPIGVSFDKNRGMYSSKCNKEGKTVNLGRFSTANQASLAYRRFKKKHIEEVANRQENEYIREYLLAHAALV